MRVQFTFDDDDEVLSNLICIICQGSPRITDLELDMVKSEGSELLSVVVEPLGRLPLLRLRICGGIIEYRPLALALPNLEYLNIESVEVDFEGLSFIAKHMPNLQYLYIDLLLQDWPNESSLPHNSSSPSPCQVASLFSFEEDFDFNTNRRDFNKELESIAR